MKYLNLTTLLISISVFAYAQEVTVKGNSKLNTDFSKYKTFTWAKTNQTALNEDSYEIYSYAEKSTASDSDPRVNKKSSAKSNQKSSKNNQTRKYYSYNVIIPATDPSTNTAIQQSIVQELEGRGYRWMDNYGDLIVTYKVLDKRSRVRGYVNDFPETVGTTEVRQPEDTVTYTLEPGSLMVNLIDNKTSEVVWNGFASGLTQGNGFANDPVKLKEAIHLIFEEFKYRADKVTTGGNNSDNNR